MYQSTYFVDKTTDTFADTLLAYGVAALLDRLLRDNGDAATVRIEDAGSVFSVHLERPIREGFEQVSWFCDLPFIQTRSKKPPEGWAGEVVDYDAQRERNRQYFEARKQLPAEAKRAGATPDEFPELAQVEGLRPRPDWQVLAQINQMSAISAYVQVLETWFACRDSFSDLLGMLLALFSTTPNNVTASTDAWKAIATATGLKAALAMATPVQVTNPAMGKGLN